MVPNSSTGGGGSRGGGGGGGGGGAKPPDFGALGQLFGYRPQQYSWQDAKYTDLKLDPYKGTGFYNFDPTQYDTMRRGVQEGLQADLAAGRTAYGDARTELQQYQNPFAGRSYTQNPQMSAAMQRMMAANGVQPDQADMARGVQADQAFGNVLALLAGNADQRQAQQLRAIGGDERRFGESLNSQGRTMTLGIDMALAKAREQYNKDKWAYGESIAQQNYQTNVQQAIANNQGQNQATMYNNQGMNQVGMANTQATNDRLGGNIDLLANLAAQGYKPPEMVVAGAAGLDPNLKAAMEALAAGGA